MSFQPKDAFGEMILEPIFNTAEIRHLPNPYFTDDADCPAELAGIIDTGLGAEARQEITHWDDYAPSWTVVHRAVNDFVALSDEFVAPTMRLLAQGGSAWPPIAAGESAVPGLAVALAASRRANLRSALGLGSDSEVPILGTEGATDPEIYRELVGRDSGALSAG